MSSPLRAKFCPVLWFALLPLYAQDASVPDFNSASLEQLMQVEISGLSRRTEKAFESPAAIYVITQDDIRRSGLTSLPEVLRMAPGVQVTRVNANQWAVTTRGFNGRFANKLLVLVDGRTVYNPLSGGVYWDMVDVFLDDVERIEVIRGPRALSMGMNAMNGVINIVTRSAGKTKGWFASFGSGSEDNVNTSLRYGGGSKGGKVDYRLYSKFFHRGDTLQTPTLDSEDTWKSFRGGVRVDINASRRDTVNLLGDVFSLRSLQLINSNFPAPGAGTTAKDPVNGSGGFLLGRWERTYSEKSNTALQVFYDRNNRSELFGRGNWEMTDLDFQHRYQSSSRNEVAWGFGFRHSRGTATGNPGRTNYVPPHFAESIYNIFVQDEHKLLPDKLAFTAGARVLDSDAAKVGVQLTGRLNWTPSKTRTLWAGVSRAVHTSSFLDRSIQLEFPVPSASPLPVVGRISATPAFDSETAISYEAGLRQSFGGLLIADAAGFVTRYEDLKQTSQGSPFRDGNRVIQPFWWVNSGSATTSGAEFSTKWNLHPHWNVTANYTFFQVGGSGRSYLPGAPTTNDTSPRHQFFGRSSLTLPRRVNWDTSVQYVSKLASGIPAYTRVDTRLARAVGEMGEWSVGVFNVLDPHHAEYAPEDYSRKTMIRRSFYIRATWGK